jgi:hypothetical protein
LGVAVVFTVGLDVELPVSDALLAIGVIVAAVPEGFRTVTPCWRYSNAWLSGVFGQEH